MNDLRYGLRRLAVSPGVTAVAVVSLALAIAANSVVFSFIHGVLLRQPPFPDPERLVMVWDRDLTSTTLSSLGRQAPPGIMSVAVPNLMDYRAQNQVFEHLVGLGSWQPTLAIEPQAIRINASGVNAELFKLLRVHPLLGRDFRPDEDDPDHDKVAILGYSLWRDSYGGDPQILGKTLRLDGKVYVVIGVMPPGFDFPEQTVLWKPLGFAAKDWERDFHLLHTLARLKPGVGVAAAQQDLARVATRLGELYPDTNKNDGVWIVGLHEFETVRYRPALLVLWAAVVFVLLLACANVSNLLLSRAVERRRELAIRLAMGAGRRRLLRQLLTESLLLALLAAGVGLFLAYLGMRAVTPLLAVKLPQLAQVRLDWTVVAVTLGMSLLTVLVFSLVPSLRGSRTDLTTALRAGDRARAGRSNRGLQQLTVVAQVAIALVLLLGAGLLIKSFNRLLRVDPGFRIDDALAVEINLMPRASYQDQARTIGFISELERRVQAMPGVISVGSTWNVPMSGRTPRITFSREGESGEEPTVALQVVTPGYFTAMGIPLLRGRAFKPSDDARAPEVVILNDEAARRYFPGRDPIGRRISFEVDFGPAGQVAAGSREIVGVVGNVRQGGLDAEVLPELYYPNYQAVWRWSTMVVHARDAARLAPAVRREIRDLDPGLALGKVQPLEQFLDDSVVQQRLSTWLLTTFSFIALVLAVIGVYGVLSYTVAQRVPEIGIRMALGARQESVMFLILLQALVLALIGVAIGVAAGFGLTRYLSSLLFNVSSLDLSVFIAVPLVLILVTLGASYLPARRATEVDPLYAIRAE